MTKIEELRAAYEAATPERWDFHQERSGHATVVDCQDVTVCRVYQQPYDTWQALDTAEFIALAHNTMPLLLEAVERLEYMQQTIAELASMNPFLRDVFDLNKAVLEKLK